MLKKKPFWRPSPLRKVSPGAPPRHQSLLHHGVSRFNSSHIHSCAAQEETHARNSRLIEASSLYGERWPALIVVFVRPRGFVTPLATARGLCLVSRRLRRLRNVANPSGNGPGLALHLFHTILQKLCSSRCYKLSERGHKPPQSLRPS